MNRPYQRIQISLLTMHGKEKVIAPEFKKKLDAKVFLVNDFNTDELGTFTRDIPRYGNQIDAARNPPVRRHPICSSGTADRRAPSSRVRSGIHQLRHIGR